MSAAVSTVEMPVWQAIGLLITLFGAALACGKLLFSQFEKRLAERFKAQDDQLAKYMADQSSSSKRVQEIEREFLLFRGDMPNLYVRRDDFIRNQTVIEAKLDTINQRVENIQIMRGPASHG